MTWPKICAYLAELKMKTSLLERIFVTISWAGISSYVCEMQNPQV
jgi:hypothetical protein